jgi:hypothetical protein
VGGMHSVAGCPSCLLQSRSRALCMQATLNSPFLVGKGDVWTHVRGWLVSQSTGLYSSGITP